MKRANLIRHLTANGCELFREGRAHSLWINRATGKMEAVPRHNEIKDHLARKIAKGLDVPPPPG